MDKEKVIEEEIEREEEDNLPLPMQFEMGRILEDCVIQPEEHREIVTFYVALEDGDMHGFEVAVDEDCSEEALRFMVEFAKERMEVKLWEELVEKRIVETDVTQSEGECFIDRGNLGVPR